MQLLHLLAVLGLQVLDELRLSNLVVVQLGFVLEQSFDVIDQFFLIGLAQVNLIDGLVQLGSIEDLFQLVAQPALQNAIRVLFLMQKLFASIQGFKFGSGFRLLLFDEVPFLL